MKTISLDMLLTGRRENYLIIDMILRVLHHVRMYTGLPNSLYRVFFKIKLTIQYPFKYTFIQTQPLFTQGLTVQAMTAKISDLTSYCKQADLFVFILNPLNEFSALFC